AEISTLLLLFVRKVIYSDKALRVNMNESLSILFCPPSFSKELRISPCGLHTTIGITLLAYIFIFGCIQHLYSRKRKTRHDDHYSQDDENDEEPLPSRFQYRGYPPSLHKLANAVQSLVGIVALLNGFYILFILAEKNRVDSKLPLYLLTSTICRFFAWTIEYYLVACERKQNQRWSYFTQGFWYLAFILTNIELYNRLVYFTKPREDDGPPEWIQNHVLMIVYISRYTITLLLVICAVTLSIMWRRSFEAQGYNPLNNQSQRSLSGENATLNEDGSPDDVEASRPNGKPISMADDPKYAPPTTVSEFITKMKKLIPFLWPTDNIRLQIYILICILLLVAGRIVNVLLPYQNKILIERLTERKFAWQEILFYVFLRFLQGDVGLVKTVQNILWIPIGQFTTREVSVKMFDHLLNLSLRFHLNRKTGEILRVQDRGVSSIVSILSYLLFNIVPTLVDIGIAVIYFTVSFDLYFGMIVFTTMSSYIIATIAITQWRTKYRREANLLDNAMEAKAVDSLLNYETVKLYAAEAFEVQQYTDAILAYQNAERKSTMSLYILNSVQNTIIQIGLVAGCLLCANRIVKEEMTVGDFIMYLTYILQLYGPLNWFGTYYRVIQKNLVDMEKMFDLLQEVPEVKDLPLASSLVVKKGEVTFQNVSFHYDPRVPILKNISFSIPSGSTVALVGPSGGGKSTILRLLFRFYDVQSGSILVDGQDIRYVKQRDLRSNIGVVPQDTVLFNDTIRYNIRYSKINATDSQVEEAAAAAQIHEKILGFPEGYETKVGERGLRLSGGEKQRVAIARTLLKNPQIVLLDEATSALDTHTERHIQKALRRMTVNRTTLIIAHRLSTIVHADQILVVQGGEIVERGSHQELLSIQNGVYYKLWNKQLKLHEKMKREAEQKRAALAAAVASGASTDGFTDVDTLIMEDEGETSTFPHTAENMHEDDLSSALPEKARSINLNNNNNRNQETENYE
ncbi:2740_t:CDS:10, partial [Ambispora leptoticha]